MPLIPRHHVIIWKHAILTQRVSLPKSFFLLGSRADLGHRKGGGCARKPNDQKIKSVVTCSVRIQDRVRCTSLTNLCLRKLRGTTRPTRLGPSGWEVVILSSCGVSPKPGCLMSSWRGGGAANRALLPGEQPMCHIVSDVTAAKGPEPPGPLITGTQMGRGGDLPGEHGRRMAKVESRDVPLEKLGKTTEPHRKFFRPCCSYLFMASCILQLSLIRSGFFDSFKGKG